MNLTRIAAACLMTALAAAAHATPTYTVVDLGLLAPADNVQGNGISPNGLNLVGRDLGSTGYRAVSWSNGGAITALQNTTTSYANAVAVNDSGLVVGITTSTAFGSNAQPMKWVGGVQTALAVPSGAGVARANAVNASGVIVGSAGSGVGERATIWTGSTVSTITATTANGSYMTTAYGISAAGLVVGNGIDPNNAAVNVGLAYNSVTGVMTSIGALAGLNGALAFGVSNNGYVVGSSMLNQGSGTPYIWSAATGMTAIPLPTGASQGSARGVNSSGWVVGVGGGQFAVPFLYDGNATYTLAQIVPTAPGWDFVTNTSSAALGISENGTIVGSAVLNGAVHAFELIPSAVPEPASGVLMVGGLLLTGWVARRRAAA